NNNVIAGNYIGTNAAGTAVDGFTNVAIQFFSAVTGTRIGTDGSNDNFNANERNVIVSGGGTAILMTGTNKVIAGNYLGTENTGAARIGGGTISIVNGATGNRVGTNADGIHDDLERNVIAPSAAGIGVNLSGAGTSNNTVAGNYIGVAADGATGF